MTFQTKELQMAKYLVQGNYVGDGLKGLLKEGGSSRRAVVEETLKSIGGALECFYYTLGEHDFCSIVDVPDNVSLAALNLVTRASGRVTSRSTVLMTAEEMDKAVKKSVNFRAPGQ
jgi:uncharacterized protein with GYD domain